jgi:acyl transferase domain-containing protein
MLVLVYGYITGLRVAGGTRTAVMVGIGNIDGGMDYMCKSMSTSHLLGVTIASVCTWEASARIAYTFGLTGQAGSINTNDSSALVALHFGFTTVKRVECEAALCCGVNMTLTPESTMLLMLGGILSTDGRCKVLDSSSDGYARAEGMSVMVIGTHRLNEGLGNIIARLPGSAINQDGRSDALSTTYWLSQIAALAAGVCLLRLISGVAECSSIFGSPHLFNSHCF